MVLLITKSLSQKLNTGKSTATHFLEKQAAPNNPKAPIGAKLEGWGINLLNDAINIRPINTKGRKLNLLFMFSLFESANIKFVWKLR